MNKKNRAIIDFIKNSKNFGDFKLFGNIFIEVDFKTHEIFAGETGELVARVYNNKTFEVFYSEENHYRRYMPKRSICSLIKALETEFLKLN